MARNSRPAGNFSAAQRRTRARDCGFSLIEMLISMAVFLLLTGMVFEQIIAMQRKATTESAKVDTTEQAREFVDQMMRDIHMAGFPKAAMYATPLDNTSPLVAAGLVSVSPTQMILEGDVNSEGQVYSVNVQYVAADANDPNCPCVRRSAVPKTAASPLAQPTSPVYTETEHLIAPGPGPGQAGEDLFAYYDQNGNKIDVTGGVDISTPGGQATIQSIKTIKVNVSLANDRPADGPGETTRMSLTGTARLKQ
ncbi:MAG TPA: type II secretion system protein [Candidatus Limnocylindrales bacterium]|nr:type II secretion system protein [Candidatus Limnocylindrales bacterium]